MNLIEESQKKTLNQFRQTEKKLTENKSDPNEMYKDYVKYEPNSVLKSGVLQMSSEEIREVDTGTPFTKFLKRTFRGLTVVCILYCIYTLLKSLITRDRSYLLQEGETSEALEPKKIIGKKTLSNYIRFGYIKLFSIKKDT